MRVTVRELISLLEQYDGDNEVVLAIQPSWPFEHSIGEVVEMPEAKVEWGVQYIDAEGDSEEVEVDLCDTAAEAYELAISIRDDKRFLDVTVVGKPATAEEWIPEQEVQAFLDDGPRKVYIGEAGQNGYLDGEAKSALGW